MDPSTPASAASDSDEPSYVEILEKRYAALPERQQDIIARRVLTAPPETLDAIAADHGVTRERIRQLESKALDRLAGVAARMPGRPAAEQPVLDPREESESTVVSRALTALDELPLPVTESALAGAGIAALDSRATQLLLGMTKHAGLLGGARPRTVDHRGRRWLVTGEHTPAVLERTLLAEAIGDGVVTDQPELWSVLETQLRPHVGSADETTDIVADVLDELDLVEVGGQYAILGGGLGIVERLARLLRAKGAPMARDDLLSFFPDRNPRTVANALTEPPFVRVTRNEYALEEWGAIRRPTLRELLYAQLDQHGRVAVAHLQDLAEEHQYSRASIAIYAGSLPDVIEQGGVLRRRQPGDPKATPEPGLDDGCFRVVSGPHRGRWSSVVTINHRRLYHGPQWIPAPLAEELAIEHGTQRVSVTVNDDRIVHATWLQSPYLFGGELRPVLDRLRFADGDRIRLIATGPRDLQIERVPVTSGPDTPYRTLSDGAGLNDGTGQSPADSDIVPTLAYAIGLEPDTPLPVIERRLLNRGNRALWRALALLFPEELGQ
jgi:hypothetical protein